MSPKKQQRHRQHDHDFPGRSTGQRHRRTNQSSLYIDTASGHVTSPALWSSAPRSRYISASVQRRGVTRREVVELGSIISGPLLRSKLGDTGSRRSILMIDSGIVKTPRGAQSGRRGHPFCEIIETTGHTTQKHTTTMIPRRDCSTANRHRTPRRYKALVSRHGLLANFTLFRRISSRIGNGDDFTSEKDRRDTPAGIPEP